MAVDSLTNILFDNNNHDESLWKIGCQSILKHGKVGLLLYFSHWTTNEGRNLVFRWFCMLSKERKFSSWAGCLLIRVSIDTRFWNSSCTMKKYTNTWLALLEDHMKVASGGRLFNLDSIDQSRICGGKRCRHRITNTLPAFLSKLCLSVFQTDSTENDYIWFHVLSLIKSAFAAEPTFLAQFLRIPYAVTVKAMLTFHTTSNDDSFESIWKFDFESTDDIIFIPLTRLWFSKNGMSTDTWFRL